MILVCDICYSGLVLWYVEKNIGDGRDTRLDPWVEGCVLRDWFSKFDGLAVDRDTSVAEMYGSNEGGWEFQWRWRRILFRWEEELVALYKSAILKEGDK